MDSVAFDRLARSLTASPSRRAAVRLLTGLLVTRPWPGASDALDVDAKRKRKKRKKKCKSGKKRCGKKCFDLQTDSAHCGSCGTVCEQSESCLNGVCGCPADEPACGGSCCATENCIGGACCPPARTCDSICCAADEICADPGSQLCVVGQGTCPSGADSCAGNAVSCNSPETCGCFQSASGATRCGQGTVQTNCGQCTTNEDCENLLGKLGAFCAKFFGGSCLACEEGQNACFIPCPA